MISLFYALVLTVKNELNTLLPSNCSFYSIRLLTNKSSKSIIYSGERVEYVIKTTQWTFLPNLRINGQCKWYQIVFSLFHSSSSLHLYQASYCQGQICVILASLKRKFYKIQWTKNKQTIKSLSISFFDY